jgi:hypothetical protein
VNRFVKGGSWTFFFLAWGVAFLLFADAANLDDLFSSNYVLHDDDEVTAGLSAVPATSSHQTTPAPGQLPPPPERVVVDQDSPSLAADADASTLVAKSLLCESAAVLYHSIPSNGVSLIKLCTLLI